MKSNGLPGRKKKKQKQKIMTEYYKETVKIEIPKGNIS